MGFAPFLTLNRFEFCFFICTSSKRCRKLLFSILYAGFLPTTLQDAVLTLPTVYINVQFLFHTRNRFKISFSPQAPTSLICGLTRNDPFIH